MHKAVVALYCEIIISKREFLFEFGTGRIQFKLVNFF